MDVTLYREDVGAILDWLGGMRVMLSADPDASGEVVELDRIVDVLVNREAQDLHPSRA